MISGPEDLDADRRFRKPVGSIQVKRFKSC